MKLVAQYIHQTHILSIKTYNYKPLWTYPRCSMYGIVTNIYPINGPSVGKYTIQAAYGLLTYYSRLSNPDIPVDVVRCLGSGKDLRRVEGTKGRKRGTASGRRLESAKPTGKTMEKPMVYWRCGWFDGEIMGNPRLGNLWEYMCVCRFGVRPSATPRKDR